MTSGLHNTLGWSWEPATGLMWGMDMGTDRCGDDAPPEELNHFNQGDNYGRPYCYAELEPDVYFSQMPPGVTKDEYFGNTAAPPLTYQAHSSPVSFIYISGDQFPVEDQGDALWAFRGSWNRGEVVGYKVVRIDFDESGQPVGAEDVRSGWRLPNVTSQFGRIASLTIMPDGSLLVSDDTNGIFYRVTYEGA